jgi:hypothetical protein
MARPGAGCNNALRSNMDSMKDDQSAKWHHAKKLTAAKAREIRERHDAGQSAEQLPQVFGVSVRAVQGV